MRKPFRKQLAEIPIEDAHGGSGKRQLILSPTDAISKNLHAMTKGFLAVGGSFDWHMHEEIDEFFLVIKGHGKIEFESGEVIDYAKDDLIYIPANIKHRIDNTSKEEGQFYFVRVNK